MPTLLEDRKADVGIDRKPRESRRRRLPRRVVVVAASMAVLALLVVVAGRVDLFPGFDNPVKREVVDRSTPPLLLALDNLSEYHAATGTFQVVIDQERNTRYIPSAISGERTVFLATGTADAYVDFRDLGPGSVRVSSDRRTVTITLPAPRVGKVRVDPNQSRVLDRDRGALERVGSIFQENPSAEGELYALAERRLGRAAAQSDLARRAEGNTRAMLTTLARSLGFEQVTVTFETAA